MISALTSKKLRLFSMGMSACAGKYQPLRSLLCVPKWIPDQSAWIVGATQGKFPLVANGLRACITTNALWSFTKVRLSSTVRHRLRAMGIHDKPIAPLSPWQNGFAERLIGSVRRECLDHTIVFGEGSPAPVADLLRKLSQPNQNASRASERRADPPSNRADWDLKSRPILG
ncbi:MAG TPA: integrase core domain-containing protein [Candidatus Acidoferrum sp.]|nr:integrase core domain-containing protein [Candidatus Acidoferrum sp.]